MPTVQPVRSGPVAAQKPKKQLALHILLADSGDIGSWSSSGDYLVNYEVDAPSDDAVSLRPEFFTVYVAPDGTPLDATEVQLEAMDRALCPKFAHPIKGRSGVGTVRCTGLNPQTPYMVSTFVQYP
jgi:hypothetical protein